jgi:hypothetical protein
MNIQQYYRCSANISLNGSLAAFVPVSFILIGSMFVSVKLPLLYLVFPFCFYSFICYQAYLIQYHRSLESVVIDTAKKTTLLDAENILVTFMPAPSLRMLLFDSNGLLIGEVRDVKFWWWRWFLPYTADRIFSCVYGLYDQDNQLIAYYRVNKRKKQVQIIDVARNILGVYHIHTESPFSLKRRGVIYSKGNKQTMVVEGSALSADIKVRNEQDFITSKLVKGWMPLEWGKHFRDANTPYMIFDKDTAANDKILIIGVLTDFFQYTSH